ncbi:MAG TPA: biotin--[acetyl-CoA-carboxylase] ligase, partial [Spirochaetota bacterium]|nr:biotin--[acetyl-CoA-carboxylase] ligase [Spirochaetota bacterium]
MYKIHHFSTIDSTNLYAMKNIDEYSDGDIVSADFQTAGRGRLGRVWT